MTEPDRTTNPRKTPGDGQGELENYSTPPDLFTTFTEGSSDQRAAQQADWAKFQENQERRAKHLRRLVRRESIHALRQSPRPNLLRSISALPLARIRSQIFRHEVRRHEHHERALIGYALKHHINLSELDWRLRTLESLAHSHPALQANPKRGRPKDRSAFLDFMEELAGPTDALNESIRLPGPVGKMPLGECIESINRWRSDTAKLLTEARPELPFSRRDSDKAALYFLCQELYPNLGGEGFNAKWYAWRNAISKARQRYREIKKKSA